MIGAELSGDFKASLDAAEDGVAVASKEGIICYINSACLDLLGYSIDEMQSLSAKTIWPALEIDRFSEIIIPENSVGVLWQGEVLAQHRDGGGIRQDLTVSALPCGSLIFVSRSVSRRSQLDFDRKPARAKPQHQRGAARKRLSHELGNLLAAVEGYAGLIRRSPQAAVNAAYAEAILKATQMAFEAISPGSSRRLDAYGWPAVASFPPAAECGRQVLVVDDNEPVAAVLVELLSRAGMDATYATDAASALERNLAEFAAIVTDLQMPGMSGHELAQTFRAAKPSLVIVAYAGGDHEAMADGVFDAMFAKPKAPQSVVEFLATRLRPPEHASN